MTDELTLDHHPLALNAGESLRPDRVDSVRRSGEVARFGRSTDWRQTAGFGAVGLGALGIVVAWFQIAGEREIWKQLPYLASGGIGGAAAVALGIALLIAFEHSEDRAALDVVLDRLDDLDRKVDERSGGAELEDRIIELEAALRELRSSAVARRSATTRAAAGRNGR